MSLEDEFTRDTRAMERIADALEAWVKIEEKRLAREFPEPRVKRDAELIRADERAEQLSDKPSPGWFDETPKEAEPSRFAKRLEAETSVEAPAPQRRRLAPLSERDANKLKPS